MTLPASGAISFNAINVELCRAGGAQLSLNDSCVRTLFGQASGAVCMDSGHGKSNTSVPGAPTIGSASSTGTTSASVSFSAPACTGHLTIDYYQAISTPGCITATGTSPISVTGLSSSTSYTFKVRAHNSKGYGAYSGSSNSITTDTPAYYMCISTSGACVYTCPVYTNLKVARWNGSGSFTVNFVGSGVGNPGNKINYGVIAGGGGGSYVVNGQVGSGGGGGGVLVCNGNLCVSGGYTVTARSYSVSIGGGGTNYGAYCSTSRGQSSSIACIATSTGGGAGQSYCHYGTYGNGGSGGGGCPFRVRYGTGISGPPRQGYDGGLGYFNSGKNDCIWIGGGGGGAAGSGQLRGQAGGYGGAGYSGAYFILGGGYIGGGGSGGVHGYGNPVYAAYGGAGGGGNGAYKNFSGDGSTGSASNGCANKGGGGGGGSGNGCGGSAFGGSGTVFIRWRFQ
jgi:hypothetical protein